MSDEMARRCARAEMREMDLRAAVSQRDDTIKALRAELDETWLGPDSPDAFRRPTAEAYGRLCGLYNESVARIRSMEFNLSELSAMSADYRNREAASLTRAEALEAEIKAMRDSSTEAPIPYIERRYPTRQDMRVEIARLSNLVRIYKPVGPVPLVMYCPAGHPHVDEGEWATRPHKTHQCQANVFGDCMCYHREKCKCICGLEWRPAEFATVGVRARP